MRMSLSRRDGLFGDPGADTIHGRGQREHVTQSVVSIIILTYIYYYLVWYQISIESTGSFKIINITIPRSTFSKAWFMALVFFHVSFSLYFL